MILILYLVVFSAAVAQAEIVKIDVPAHFVYYDESGDKLFAAVSSRLSGESNSVRIIEPATGQVETVFPLVEEPKQLDVSSDGSVLWVNYGRYIQPISLPGGELLSPIAAPGRGNSSFCDIAHVPNRPGALLATFSDLTDFRIALIQQGVILPEQFAAPNLKYIYPAGRNQDVVYADNQLSIFHLRVGPNGVSLIDTSGPFGYGEKVTSGAGLLFSRGAVLDPQTDQLVGRLVPGLSAASESDRRIYHIFRNALAVYDLDTLAPLRKMKAQWPGIPQSLTSAGPHRIAFPHRSQVWILKENDIPLMEFSGLPEPEYSPRGLIRIPVPAEELVYSSHRHQIYATTAHERWGHNRSVFGRDAVLVIDTDTGFIINEIQAGTTPRRLALSDSGRYLFVGGAAVVRRIDLDTGEQELFPLGRIASAQLREPEHGFVADIAVLPGSEESFAISYSIAPGKVIGFRTSEIVIYDRDRRRADFVSSHAADTISFGSEPEWLYGMGASGNQAPELHQIRVDESGARVVQSIDGFIGTITGFDGFLVRNNVLINEQGWHLSDPGLIPLGRMPTSGSIATRASSRLVRFFSSFRGSPRGFRHQAYDLDTLRQVGEGFIFVPLREGVNVWQAILVGPARAAIRSDEAIYLTPLSFEFEPRVGPRLVSEHPAEGIRKYPVDLRAEFRGSPIEFSGDAPADIAWDERNGQLLASYGANAGPLGNTVVALDPNTGAWRPSPIIGSQPAQMEFSRDGRSLWVELEGSGSLCRLDPATLQPLDKFFSGFHEDFAIAPKKHDRIAVAHHDDVRVFDGAVLLPQTKSRFHNIGKVEFGSSPDVLYGSNNRTTKFGFYRYDLDESGVVNDQFLGQLFPGFGNATTVRYLDGLIYSSTGRVVLPETGEMKGWFPDFGHQYIDALRRRVYVFRQIGVEDTFEIRVFDMGTFREVASRTFSLGVSFRGLHSPYFGRLSRAGPDQLALLLRLDGLYIIDEDFLEWSAPRSVRQWPARSRARASQTSPTPPTPAWKNGIARLEAEGVTALAYSAARERLYASTGVDGGVLGHSILEIEPTSGASTRSKYVGVQPTFLEVAGDYLYVALHGESRVLRLDLETLRPEVQNRVPREFGPMGIGFVTGLTVDPDNPKRYAIAVRERSSSANQYGVFVFDDDRSLTRSEQRHGTPRVSQVRFGRSGQELFGIIHGADVVFTLEITPDQVLVSGGFRAKAPFRQLEYAHGRLFGDQGGVADLGQNIFDLALSPPAEFEFRDGIRVAADDASDRVYWLMDTDRWVERTLFDRKTILAYDPISLKLVESVTLDQPILASGERPSAISSFEIAGPGRLAIATVDEIILVDTSILHADGNRVIVRWDGSEADASDHPRPLEGITGLLDSN